MNDQITNPEKFIRILKESQVFQDFDVVSLQKLLMQMRHKRWKAGQ